MSTTQNGLDLVVARIAQAQRMVAAQAKCSLDEALEQMRALGEASDVGLRDIAAAVLDGSIRLDD